MICYSYTELFFLIVVLFCVGAIAGYLVRVFE